MRFCIMVCPVRVEMLGVDIIGRGSYKYCLGASSLLYLFFSLLFLPVYCRYCLYLYTGREVQARTGELSETNYASGLVATYL